MLDTGRSVGKPGGARPVAGGTCFNAKDAKSAKDAKGSPAPQLQD
jgi:hypothetical protein